MEFPGAFFGRPVHVVCVLVALMSAAHTADAASYAGRLAHEAFVVGQPGQFFLSFGETDSECVLSWTSSLVSSPAPQYYMSVEDFDGVNASAYYGEVQYGYSADVLSSTQTAYANIYTEGRCGVSRLMHSVPLKCTPGTAMFYRVRTIETYLDAIVPSNDWSSPEPFTFPSSRAPFPDGSSPVDVAVIGDMSVRPGSSVSTIAGAVSRGEVEFAVHHGDIAYNLDDDCGYKGDEFMEGMQGITAHVPYVWGMGDHEAGRKFDPLHAQPNGFDYDSFVNRFGGANGGQLITARTSLSPTLTYFSFERRGIHWIVLNTNCYLQPQLFWQLRMQYLWLEQDLKSVNRTRTPWVLVSGHRQMYCTKNDDSECNQEADALRYGVPVPAYQQKIKTAKYPATKDTPRTFGLEELYHAHGVDLYFAGHTHIYQRTWPVYREKASQQSLDNPAHTVYVTAGICGEQGHDPMDAPAPAWEAYRDVTFTISYGHLRVHNSTHLTYMQRRATDNSVLDAFTLSKKKASSSGDGDSNGEWEGWFGMLGLGGSVVLLLALVVFSAVVVGAVVVGAGMVLGVAVPGMAKRHRRCAQTEAEVRRLSYYPVYGDGSSP